MYVYKGARVREPIPRPRWKEKDVGGETLMSLFDHYREVIFELEHPLYDYPLALNLHDLLDRFKVRHSQKTIVEFLAGLGNSSVPTTDTLPSLEVTYANFVDANQAGFEIKPVNTIFHHDVPLPKGQLYDLRLTRPGVDPREMFDHCLVTVNGLFHRTNFTGDSVNVLEGGVSARHANKYQVGVYHLGNLGKIQTVPIRVKHVHRGNSEDQPLGEKTYIEVDDRALDLDGKSVLVSIGGYLHLPDDGIIRRAGERVWSIDFKDYPLAQRFFEMSELLDLTAVEKFLERSTVNDTQISVEQLYSDDVIKAILQLSQSFFVIVDTPELFLDKEHVEFNQLPGSYITYESPRYPLVMGYNRIHEYWTRKERDRYVLSVDGGLRANYLFETTGWKEEHSIDTSRVPSQLIHYDKAFFWKLGKNT